MPPTWEISSLICLDLAWWQEFFKSWNGCSFLQYLQWAPMPYFKIPSDTSGALGYAAVFQCHWFSTSIPTSTLLSPMSTLTLSTLRWSPFAKVAISTLVLRNIISAPCAPLPCIYMYMSMAQRLAHISFSLRHHSKLTMADIWYLVFNPLRCWGPWLLHRS